MNTIQISGGKPLEGEIPIQGSKNASLPVLAAALLVPGVSVIRNCPQITDTALMLKLLRDVGCRTVRKGHTVYVDASVISGTFLQGNDTARMRSSVILMGALLGRMGEITLGYPGGCVIGERPIDLHLDALRRMGAQIEEQEGRLCAQAARLGGAQIRFRMASVGATENVILAAVLAKGRTVIENAAAEPEIDALCEFLTQAGAVIGREKNRIIVDGVTRLCPGEYRIPADRIVAGTYLLGCMAAGGDIFLKHAPAGQLEAVTGLASCMGADIRFEQDGIGIKSRGRVRPVPRLETQVYPGFPTDLQSPLLAVLATAAGDSLVEETIFENRFRIVEPLCRMGADMITGDRYVRIRGVAGLHGAEVTACELRGGAGLAVAGLAAQGITRISQDGYIERGYENLVGDFRALGADIAYGEAEK